MRLLDRILDKTVVFSFDRSGFARHEREFDPDDTDVTMDGKVCLVTGANAGLGYALARGLAERGATVHMLCRDERRGEEARRTIIEETGNEGVELHVVDISRLESVRGFVDTFPGARVDVLVHNAGLLPSARQLTGDGFELTVATHILGPFLLTRLLRPKLRGSRVIFMTSGGMYAKRFDLDEMLDGDRPYDGVAAYARTKRAQVVLTELLAVELAGEGTTVNAVHPGWAATGGVERSLPRFWKLLRDRLRTPEQGADTALWLAVSDRAGGETGGLWFDRRSVPKHIAWWTEEEESERQRLWSWCEEVVS